MSCAFGKVVVETTRHIGVELPKEAGQRMMQAAEADKHGLCGQPLTCDRCPYSRTCPEVVIGR